MRWAAGVSTWGRCAIEYRKPPKKLKRRPRIECIAGCAGVATENDASRIAKGETGVRNDTIMDDLKQTLVKTIDDRPIDENRIRDKAVGRASRRKTKDHTGGGVKLFMVNFISSTDDIFVEIVSNNFCLVGNSFLE